MSRFAVPDMSCDACVRAITRAVRGVDAAADIRVDLAGHVVEIRSTLPDPALAAAITGAGYTIQHAA